LPSVLASLLVALAFAGLASRPALPPQSAGCYVLRLGPAVSSDTAPLIPPGGLDLLPGGRLAATRSINDSLVAADAPIWGWRQSDQGEIDIWWSAGWIGGRLNLHLSPAPDGLRGRYALHFHQVDDGRSLWRGNAYAIRVRCLGLRLLREDAQEAVRTLSRWESTQHPDTSLAVAEALQAFVDFLHDTPIHSLSLVNYGIAEFACRRGHLPRDLAELRAATTTPSFLSVLEDRSYQDAWGRPLKYSPRPPGYEVRSAGPDGRFGTADDLVSALATPLGRDPTHDCRW
jgi:hypothetical protein